MTPHQIIAELVALKHLGDQINRLFSIGETTANQRAADGVAEYKRRELAIDAAARAFLVEPETQPELPPEYMLAKLAMVMPLFQEARDALCAIKESQRVMHGISKTLADRMDTAGTFSLDDWQALKDTP